MQLDKIIGYNSCQVQCNANPCKGTGLMGRKPFALKPPVIIKLLDNLSP